MKSESYGAFAWAYDKGLGQRFFRAAKRVLIRLLEKYPTDRKTHLDVACGTGLAVDFFRARGWSSVGVDLSLEMLAVARRRRARRLVTGDFRQLPLRGTFSRITCLYDSLNHLESTEELEAAFAGVRSVMDRGSLFFFDMNHPDVYPAVWGMNEPFVAEGADYRLELATAYRRRDATGLALVTGWALLPGGTRVEIHERHEQRAFSEGEIAAAVRAGGLVPVEVIDFDPYHDTNPGRVKLFFVCRRKSASK
jgi:SAM-dependent methyltransferase